MSEIITNIEDKKLDPFRSLKKIEIENQEVVIVESPKLVSKLKGKNLNIYSILCTPELKSEYDTLVGEATQLIIAADDVLSQLVGYKYHRGVMAIIEKPKPVELKELETPICVLNGVTSPENVGAICRTIAGLGIKSLLLDSKSTHPYIRRAIRVSMGNVFHLNYHVSKNLPEDLLNLKSMGIEIIGTGNFDDADIIHQTSYKKECALIIGSEGHGIDEKVLPTCDRTLKIPILNETMHFNASNAASICFYELAKNVLFNSRK